MKGVMLGICPDVTLVDITHDIPAHDVLSGALELVASYRYFPPGTIFLVVVDPGVGSARRGLAADVGDHRFVAPDNGVLTAVFRTGRRKSRRADGTRYARPTGEPMFEGRDRFAPAAAWIAKGIQLTALGRAISDYCRLDIPVALVAEDSIHGTVLRVDRFGNLVSNIDRRGFEKLAQGSAVEIAADGNSVTRLVATYADIQPGEVCALFGSTDHLELAANSGRAAEKLSLARGANVSVRRTQ
jgi:S-adenosylmethionine hydrolase